MENYIEKLKKLIPERKKSVFDFANAIKKSPNTVYRYFDGRSKIDVDTLYVAASFLEVPIVYFFSDKIYNVVPEENIVSEKETEYLTMVDALKKEILYLNKINFLLEKENAMLTKKTENPE